MHKNVPLSKMLRLKFAILEDAQGTREFDESANVHWLCVLFNFMIMLLCYVYYMIINDVQNF